MKELQIFLQSLGQGCIASNGQMETICCVVWAQLASLVQKGIVEINKLDIHVGASQLAIGLIESLNLFNEAPAYKSTVYVRSNEKIQALNQAYRQLANAYMNVQFIDLYDAFLDEKGQLRPDYTTDGLHLTIAGYAALSKALQETL